MGHRYDDATVAKEKDIVSYGIEKGSTGGVEVKLADKNYRPEEVSAMILSKIKADAEAKLGHPVTEAVITVPAYFDDAQRQATKDAGQIAGLEVKRIINEPTAAALAYGFNKKKDETVVVFDFGGGTFDVSVLEVSEDTIEVKSTDGDSHMGGRDIDQAIINWIAESFKNSDGIDLRKDALALQRLDESAEKAKHELSTTTETEINIPFVTSDASGPKHLVMTLSRSKLEELAVPYIEKSIEITKRAVEASPFKIGEINEIILVGGQTRMPAIVEAVKSLFGKEPNKSINPDEVVALGAAVQGGVLQGDVKDVLLLDVIPLSLGIETLGGVATPLIERNTTIPATKSQVFSTAADNQTSTEIHIVQGERPMAADNKSLGRFVLEGIPPAPRGVPQIEVSFDVDANGILNVKAKDNTSGKEQSIRIEASSGLSDEDIEKMKKDAEIHADDDKKKKEAADIRNTADMTVFAAEKAIKDAGQDAPEDVKKGIEEKVESLKKVKELPESSHDDIKKATEELSTEMQKIHEHLAKKAQEAQAANAGAKTEAGSADATQEAEVVNEDEKDAESKEEDK